MAYILCTHNRYLLLFVCLFVFCLLVLSMSKGKILPLWSLKPCGSTIFGYKYLMHSYLVHEQCQSLAFLGHVWRTDMFCLAHTILKTLRELPPKIWRFSFIWKPSLGELSSYQQQPAGAGFSWSPFGRGYVGSRWWPSSAPRLSLSDCRYAPTAR